MPIYEFFCQACNRIYRFFSRSVNTESIPNCPRCKTRKLKKMVSLFSCVSRGKDEADDSGMPTVDETRMEQALSMLARESEGINEDDPRQAATLMRKLTDATGLSMGPAMEEAMTRLEQGEDPETIEEDMGDLFDGDVPFVADKGGKSGRRKEKPAVDETLYEM